MSETNKSEENVIEMPNYVVKLKQDRYGMWQCGELRIQADNLKDLNQRLNSATKTIENKCRILNTK
jgi:hypothetical protein